MGTKNLSQDLGHTLAVNALAYADYDDDVQSYTEVASGSNDKTIMVWNVKSGALERTLTGHS